MTTSPRKYSTEELPMESTSEFVVNLAGFLVNGFGVFYGVFYISERGEGILYYRGWPGKFKYLTFWNQIIQTVYYMIGLLKTFYIKYGNERSNEALTKKIDADGQIIIRREKRNKIHRFRDALHASIVFPVGSFVVVTFWILYFINRELVFPKNLDRFVPAWQNHVSHTYPLIILLCEKYFVEINYLKRKRNLTITAVFALIYQIWLLWIAYYTDIWVYPVLRVLNFAGKCVFFLVLHVQLFFLYLLGEFISRSLWNSKLFGNRRSSLPSTV